MTETMTSTRKKNGFQSEAVLNQYQIWNHTATVGEKRQQRWMETVRCSINDGALPVAAISGSLPWRSASSHWYKATEEPHAEKPWSKKTEENKNGSNVITKA